MDGLTFVAEIVKVLAWPALIVVLVLILRDPISKLIPFLEKLKYKDFELFFRGQLREISNEAKQAIPEIGDQQPPSVLDSQEIEELAQDSPVASIKHIWKKLEEISYNKIKELHSIDSSVSDRVSKNNSVQFLMYSGVFIPPVKKLLEKLYRLQTQLQGYPDYAVSSEDALEYLSLAQMAQKQIEALVELPSMRLNAITLILQEINSVIDTGKHDSITIDDVHHAIEAENVIGFLKDRIGDDIDLSIFGPDGPYVKFEEIYNKELKNILHAYGGDERRKWGVENSGLCLLVAWTCQIIQLGSGWQPDLNI